MKIIFSYDMNKWFEMNESFIVLSFSTMKLHKHLLAYEFISTVYVIVEIFIAFWSERLHGIYSHCDVMKSS